MRQPLTSKISVAVVGVLALAALSSLVAIGSAYRFEAMLRTLVAENLQSVRAAEELEIALLEQRGYVSSYILDQGNRKWLQELDRHRQAFDEWLGRARQAARSDKERDILDRLEVVQQAYARKRDEAVELYDGGSEEHATQILLRDVAVLYQEAFDLCEQFIDVNQQLVNEAMTSVRRQVERITVVIAAVLLITVSLGFALLWLFFRGVIFPLRRIAADVRTAAVGNEMSSEDFHTDELRELGRYVQLLMTDVAETRSDLEHSRTQLAHSDKLAAVGKLAAGVAHEIRNPLTAIKMWLYSLRRNVQQDNDTQQKFGIIAEEIGRLESIVRNFLEFSKPQKLQVEPISVERILDKTVELLWHRFEAQSINVERNDAGNLPQVLADAEQLQQVFLNLLNNSVDAMPNGGKVRITCSRSHHGGRAMVTVRLADSGPGIPQEVKERIFEPFFTTKDEGTGLGLCIAASVMARHRGLLELESTDTMGTQWTVRLPAA